MKQKIKMYAGTKRQSEPGQQTVHMANASGKGNHHSSDLLKNKVRKMRARCKEQRGMGLAKDAEQAGQKEITGVFMRLNKDPSWLQGFGTT